MNKILVADNEITLAGFIKKILEYEKSLEAEVHIAGNSNEFDKYINNNSYAAILIDLNFTDKNILEFISTYSQENPYVPVIAMAATLDLNVALSSMRSGAYDFLTKPFTTETLLLVFKNAFEKRQLMIEKDKLSEDIQNVNEQLMNANELITKQKEQMDNSLKEIIDNLEKIKKVSTTLSRIKSVETNINSIFEKLNEVYKPISSVLMLYEANLKKFIVKREFNYDSGFSVGTQMDLSIFKHYFEADKVCLSDSQDASKNQKIVIIPLETGNMILGIILFEVKKELLRESDMIFYEILRYMFAISILNSKFLEDSRRSYIESLMAFLLLEEKIHKGIKKHCEMVAALSVKIAKKINLPENDIRNIQYAGLLHLLGITTLSGEILNSENYFNNDDGLKIRKAILDGSGILTPLAFLENAKKIIEGIFENYDGSGFPSKLKGQGIQVESRILRIASEYFLFKDMFKMNSEDIVNYFKKNSGIHYDPEIVKELLNFMKKN